MTQKIKFWKMQGLGNDFVVIDAINQTISLTPSSIQTLSHRQRGIGFDQLLLVEKSTHADVFCRIFNADGNEAEQCGNGMRCVALFVKEEKLSHKKLLRIETRSGIVEAKSEHTDIQVTMNVPHFFESNDSFTALSIGNPHAILQVTSLDDYPVAENTTRIAAHALFPDGVNVGFMEIIDRKHIRLRTIERGAGETFSCGSNACAAVVAGIKNNMLDQCVTVQLKYGNLIVEWQGEGYPVMLTGPAVKVFEGVIDIQ